MPAAAMPVRLLNGEKLPKNFRDICDSIGSTPKYKIVVSCADSYNRNQRIIHAYYVRVTNNDPSFIQKFMASKSIAHMSGYEDGRKVDDMYVYSFKTDTNNLIFFQGLITQLISDNSENYVMNKYFNLVQFSHFPHGDETVMTFMDYQ